MIGINTPTSDSFIGNGTQSNFNIPFPVYEYDTLLVYVIDDNDIKTNLVAEVDYEVNNIDLLDYDHSLSLIDNGQAYINAGNLATNYTLYVEFTDQAFQPAILRNLGSFAPVAIEKALDRITLSTKRAADSISETLQQFVDGLADIAEMKRYGYNSIIVGDAGAFTAVAGDIYIIKASGAVTVNLPATPQMNDAVHVKRRGIAHDIIIDANGSTVDGSGTFSLPSLESAVTILYDGAEWVII